MKLRTWVAVTEEQFIFNFKQCNIVDKWGNKITIFHLLHFIKSICCMYTNELSDTINVVTDVGQCNRAVSLSWLRIALKVLRNSYNLDSLNLILFTIVRKLII